RNIGTHPVPLIQLGTQGGRDGGVGVLRGCTHAGAGARRQPRAEPRGLLGGLRVELLAGHEDVLYSDGVEVQDVAVIQLCPVSFYFVRLAGLATGVGGGEPAQAGLPLVRELCVVGESQPGAFGESLLDVLGGLVRCAGYGVCDAAEDVLDPRCERGGLWHCSPSCSVAWWRVYSPPAAGAFRKTPPAGLAEESMARAVVSVDSHAG